MKNISIGTITLCIMLSMTTLAHPGTALTPTVLEGGKIISAEESSVNIGVVDFQRVIDESKKGIETRRHFEGLISLISEEELRIVKQQLISEIVKEIEIVIKEYAKREGFTDIMEKLEGGVISNNKSFDITNVIIELYDRN